MGQPDRALEALRLLACPAEDQVAAFPSFVVVADEIALVFDDEYKQIRSGAGDPNMNETALALLDAIDQELSSMSDDRELWTEAALTSNERWARVRKLAREALQALGSVPAKPQLDWLVFVPSTNG